MSSPASPAAGQQGPTHVQLNRFGALQFAQAARTRTLPLAAYAGLLRCLAVVFEAFERAADGAAQPDGGLRRLNLLNKDLDAVAGRELAPIPEAELRALMLAERIRLWAEHDRASLRGAATILGGPAVAVAAPSGELVACFGFKRGHGTAFVSRAEQAVQGTPQDFIAESAGGNLAAERTAADLLGMIAACHPAGSRPLRELARVLNPQAGNYLIPDDLVEIRAALRAGARTWDEIPYYGLRFAERGREWTWSDSCWLTTLAMLDQKAIDAQIAWIGRLLGSRGMPQLLLEQHLYALVDELGAARPGERGRYARLGVAAGVLAEQRRAQIDDDTADALAAAFDALELGGPREARLGAVLVAAVADEAAGVPQAVESVLAWLAEPGRFPQPWVDAVHGTIEAARTAVRT